MSEPAIMTRRFLWLDGTYVDMTPATEKVLAALRSARERNFLKPTPLKTLVEDAERSLREDLDR